MGFWTNLSALSEALAPWREALLVSAMAASFIDYSLTALLVQRAGPEIESNRLLRWIIIRAGMAGLWSFWLAWWAAISWLGMGPLWAAFFLTFNIAIVVNNVLVLKSLTEQEDQISQ